MKYTIEKRIMNYHTDSFGIVHHARYLELMEEARWSYCYENKLIDFYHERGIYHVIAGITIDYKASARFGDMIKIDTAIERVSDKSIVFRHLITNADQLLVMADIVNVYLDKATQKIIPPSDMTDFWQDLEGR